MSYTERIKNFKRIRDYMREFYVYGFKHRDEYTKKSARSYDDEKRRMESILGDYMRFRQNADGKSVFLSIDSRSAPHNPFHKAWKAKSFTDGDITIHFVLMDILSGAKDGITLSELLGEMTAMLPETARFFDESTVRKKLKEYAAEGIVRAEKRGRTVLYFPERVSDVAPLSDALDFFSEIAPCGVIGSFLLDKTNAHETCFSFKHHYITGAIDSEIVCTLFEAMGQKKAITLTVISRQKDTVSEHAVVPLQIMVSAQSGRQYLMAYMLRFERVASFRIDNILSVRPGETCDRFDEYRAVLDGIRPRIWGVSTQGHSGERLEHVDFTVRFFDDEDHIPKRLEREKRCGTITYPDAHTCRFSADVFDATELIPWIRTFLCRITEINFSDKKLQKQFEDDLEAMYALYGVTEGGDEHAVQ